MEATVLKYKVIKDKDQYRSYCCALEELLSAKINSDMQDEIDLLTLLIETYDEEHNSFTELDPIALLRSLMTDHHLKAQHLVDLLGVSKGYISDILAYKKGLSKEVIRKLSAHFKMRQEAFNRPYPLVG
ncbi:type II toxin-antitoxin system HigA family antitoxin [Mucilaginibacter sp. AK015]|uniref:helix-turn-helix domain-containing protein n=1 Tax=Mucilaginibacter sp. AK015 TaxID=2723072 RepID=UPI0016163014|nr:transcriptional regulator [Mucilaginibacter sp. AK015]